jgi:hypothetical protein
MQSKNNCISLNNWNYYVLLDYAHIHGLNNNKYIYINILYKNNTTLNDIAFLALENSSITFKNDF